MKKFAIEIKWAILFAVISLIWMLGERVAGLHDENIEHHAVFTNFFIVVAIAVYVVALLDKRKNSFGGKMNWIQGFISGLIITLGVTILTPLTQSIPSTLITPDDFAKMIAYTVESGQKTLEEAEAYFNLKSYMIQSTMFAPVAGLITSAIVAIFTRKK